MNHQTWVYELYYEWKMPHHKRKRKYCAVVITSNMGRCFQQQFDWEYCTITGLRPIRAFFPESGYVGVATADKTMEEPWQKDDARYFDSLKRGAWGRE